VASNNNLEYVFVCMSSKKLAIKQQLCDQFIQKWFSDLDNSAREFYKVVKKKDFKFEQYLIRLSKQDRN
jgi:hypothetical protein